MGKESGLPWPRGHPPTHGSPVAKNKPHWSIGDQVRCTECGATGQCGHKNLHARKMNSKWEELAEGKDNRPAFWDKPKEFRNKVKEYNLGVGEPLPPGVRRDWDSYPGNEDVRIDSPRRHGEWKLVFVPRDKSKDNNKAMQMDASTKRSRSTNPINPVAQRHVEARAKWDEENIPIPFDRAELRSKSMTPGTNASTFCHFLFAHTLQAPDPFSIERS